MSRIPMSLDLSVSMEDEYTILYLIWAFSGQKVMKTNLLRRTPSPVVNLDILTIISPERGSKAFVHFLLFFLKV